MVIEEDLGVLSGTSNSPNSPDLTIKRRTVSLKKRKQFYCRLENWYDSDSAIPTVIGHKQSNDEVAITTTTKDSDGPNFYHDRSSLNKTCCSELETSTDITSNVWRESSDKRDTSVVNCDLCKSDHPKTLLARNGEEIGSDDDEHEEDVSSRTLHFHNSKPIMPSVANRNRGFNHSTPECAFGAESSNQTSYSEISTCDSPTEVLSRYVVDTGDANQHTSLDERSCIFNKPKRNFGAMDFFIELVSSVRKRLPVKARSKTTGMNIEVTDVQVIDEMIYLDWVVFETQTFSGTLDSQSELSIEPAEETKLIFINEFDFLDWVNIYEYSEKTAFRVAPVAVSEDTEFFCSEQDLETGMIDNSSQFVLFAQTEEIKEIFESDSDVDNSSSCQKAHKRDAFKESCRNNSVKRTLLLINRLSDRLYAAILVLRLLLVLVLIAFIKDSVFEHGLDVPTEEETRNYCHVISTFTDYTNASFHRV